MTSKICRKAHGQSRRGGGMDAWKTGGIMDKKVCKAAVEPMTIYVWDMDETLILLKSLLDGKYAGVFNGVKDARKGVEIGKQWEKHILNICDECFFYKEIEKNNEPFLDSLIEYDDGRDLSDYDFKNDGFSFPYDDSNKRKLAYRHRLIAEKYSQGLPKLLDQHLIKHWNDLYNLTDCYTDGWLSSAHSLLEQSMGKTNSAETDIQTDLNPAGPSTNKGKSVNVLVTSGSLVPSLAKCLLYRLDDVIPAKNVYSSWEVGKLQCFSWIKERFRGLNVRFCAIGDGPEECAAAETMRWPFIKIELRPSCPYRFPGLTMKIVQSRIDAIYGLPDDEVEDIFAVEDEVEDMTD
ncbi:eyes absent homolog isoform X3 [Zingiber officinale]|uniref:eyes absent homolog isoform X3 n=1 Tax=Zingiber officinale TaxID=94328 RepID=UPI001C4B49EA|nr:eyes absent homolog isoform X3 [Zingiber officinale]